MKSLTDRCAELGLSYFFRATGGIAMWPKIWKEAKGSYGDYTPSEANAFIDGFAAGRKTAFQEALDYVESHSNLVLRKDGPP